MRNAIYAAAYGAAYARFEADWMRDKQTPPDETKLVIWACTAHAIATNAAELWEERIHLAGD